MIDGKRRRQSRKKGHAEKRDFVYLREVESLVHGMNTKRIFEFEKLVTATDNLIYVFNTLK